MPRVRVRTTQRGKVDQQVHGRTFFDVQRDESIRRAAEVHGVCHVTLFRYCKRRAEAGGQQTRAPGYRAHNKGFTEEQEKRLQVRKFAYELDENMGLKTPCSWEKNQMAGKDWITFLECNKTLSIRRPQATSMSRSTSFNKINVTAFFKNLKTALTRYNFEAKDFWNMDETVPQRFKCQTKSLPPRGSARSVLTSGERGTLVTVAFAANAQGNFVPPYFIFPRKKFQNHFIRDGPLGCSGSANGSGWMQETDFLAFLQNFARHTRVTPESKLLLLLDNHPSHLSVVVIDFCKSHGIVLLSFPPHCSHRLQPLDRSVFGPLKHYINSAADNWMGMNPGRTLTIYNIPSLVAKALPQAATAGIISSGFECTGIWPLNPDIFSETDFAPAFVTDRPAPAPAPSPMPVPAPSPAPSSSPMSAPSPAPSSSPMSASSPAHSFSGQ